MKRKWLWLALGLTLLAAAAAAAYFLLFIAPARQLSTLEAQEGEFRLREQMRPVGSGPRVLIFAFDGVGDTELRESIRSGKAPRIQSLLGGEVGEGVFEHGYDAPDAVSILPSTTMAAWSSIYTGQPAARTGVPGNEWFARDEMRFYAPAPVTVLSHKHTLEMITSGLVGNALRTPTLYDLVSVRSYVSLSPVYRGADLFTTPEPSDIVEVFGEMAEGLAEEGNSASWEAYSEVDQESVETLIESLHRHGIPNLQVVSFPGVDLYSHVADDPLARQKEYLQAILDVAIGRVLDEYEKAGLLNETYVLFISDHGHTPVLNDDRHSLATEGEDEPPALIEKLGFRLREFELEPDSDEQDYQAAVAYQGAMAYVYLADRSSCPNKGDHCDWNRGPRLEEDVMPVVRAFYEANETGQYVPELKGTIDLIFAREPRPVSEEAAAFKIFDGERLLPIGEYLKQHPRPDLIQLEERMQGLAAGPYGHRAGDILLLSRSGLERPIEDRYYFSGMYKSWHGSPAFQDSRIPFVLARKSDSGARLRQVVDQLTGRRPSQLHVVPLVRALLGQN